MTPLPLQHLPATTSVANGIGHHGMQPPTVNGPFQYGHLNWQHTVGGNHQATDPNQLKYIVVSPTQQQPPHGQTHEHVDDLTFAIDICERPNTPEQLFAHKDQKTPEHLLCHEIQVQATLHCEENDGHNRIVDIQFDKNLQLNSETHKNILDRLNTKFHNTNFCEQKLKVLAVLFFTQTAVTGVLLIRQSFFSFMYTEAHFDHVGLQTTIPSN